MVVFVKLSKMCDIDYQSDLSIFCIIHYHYLHVC